MMLTMPSNSLNFTPPTEQDTSTCKEWKALRGKHIEHPQTRAYGLLGVGVEGEREPRLLYRKNATIKGIDPLVNQSNPSWWIRGPRLALRDHAAPAT